MIIFIILYSYILKLNGKSEASLFLNYIGFFALASSITNWFALQIMLEKLSFLFMMSKIRSYLFPLKNYLLKNIFLEKNCDELKNKCLNGDCGIILSDVDKEKIKNKVDELECVTLMKIFNQAEGAKKLEDNITSCIYGIDEDIRAKLKEGINENEQNKIGQEFFNEEILPIIDNKIEIMTIDIQEIINEVIRDYYRWLVLWGAFCGMGFGIVIYTAQFYFKLNI